LPAAVADLEGVWQRSGLRSALIAPLRRQDEAIGALVFAIRPPARYDADDIQISNLLAAGLSAALETARLYQALADERSTLAAVLTNFIESEMKLPRP
jgi:GAF domain-containing protein